LQNDFTSLFQVPLGAKALSRGATKQILSNFCKREVCFLGYLCVAALLFIDMPSSVTATKENLASHDTDHCSPNSYIF
jgi:hypothetical protein